jgi:hypothetical protein
MSGSSDAAIADLVLAAYEYDGVPAVWDRLWAPADNDGIYAGLKRLGEVDLIVFRGSKTALDWARDFFFADNLLWHHSGLGTLHAGFALGLEALSAAMLPELGPRVIIAGHSLGAARALICAGFLTLSGHAPERIVVFGEPRPGFSRLGLVLAAVPIASYRNGNASGRDPVTYVPLAIPEIAPYVHPREPLIDVTAAPAPADAFGPFGWHHMALYAQALDALPT